MRVLFLSAANSIHTQRWVNALAEKGIEIVLVSLPNHSAKNFNYNTNINIHYLPHAGTKGYYLNVFALKKIIKLEDIDFIHAHYASGYGTLARLSKFHPLLLSVWGSDVFDFPNENKFKFHLVKMNLNNAEYIASTSESMAKITKKIIGNEKRIFVTPFGVNINQFTPRHLKKDEFNIFRFITVKTLSYKYGIDFLIKSYKRFLELLSENNISNNTIYEIYGEGDQLQELKKLIDSMNLNDKIILKGYVNNEILPEILNTGNIFLLGSRLESESFGVAAVEAMSCGIPIIATDVSGFKEVLDNGNCGILIPCDDIVAFANSMFDLYTSIELQENYSMLGRKRVEELYSWDKNVDSMISIYCKILERKE